jgi:amino acid adenylation domain-containing protein
MTPMGGSAARSLMSEGSHSWCVRLPAGFDLVRAAQVITEHTGGVLWTEPVPAGPDSPLARTRSRREMRRGVARTDAFRAVALRHAGGTADLVLAAHRAVLDTASLRLIADAVVRGGRPEGTSVVPRGQEPPVQCGDDATTDAAPGVVRTTLAGSTERMLPVLTVAAGLVLARYTGEQGAAVIVRTGVSARPPLALGAFEGETSVPVDLSGRASTADLLDDAARRLDAVEPGRVPDGTAATSVAILATAVPTPAGEQYLPSRTAPYAFTLVPRPGGDGTVALELHYRRHEVDRATAIRFVRHVALAYRQLRLADPTQAPATVELVGASEAASLDVLGRPAPAPDRHPARMDEAFAAVAAAQPDAVALTCGDRSMTYAELDERASRIAAGLLAAGVRRGERVGICLERSLDLVVTMLAVLRAGAVYVPMDPAHPAERLAYIAGDARLRLVVSEVAVPGAGTVRPEALASSGDAVPAADASPDDPAYVIYTSGSTGRPKGVVVPHRNVIALITGTRTDFALGPSDTWTLFHSCAFDFSVWEVWGSLLSGARLVIVPYWVSRSPEEFRSLLAAERVTVLNQTPHAFAQLVDADRTDPQPLDLRLVVLGGDVLDARMLRPWFDRHPESECRVVNMFGITETTVHVTAQTITRHETMTGTRSVGRAVPGWSVSVRDEHGRHVPCGAPGEIYVGGEGVALGYLDRPGLTEQRFVLDNPTGARLYRSGDRGRLLPDGRLEHLGRLDDQVKVRGHRIELDEIKNVLLEDPSVLSAVVVRGGDASRDAAGVRLDAYVVLDGGDPAAVRRRASELLPAYMLPATVTAVAALPLTVNGKLDVGSLPPPAPPAPAPATAAPGDQLSAALTEVWESVLGTAVGPDDNFFLLGGNSLYAVRVAAAMRDRGLPAVPLRELFTNPTVRRLAAVVAEADAG